MTTTTTQNDATDAAAPLVRRLNCFFAAVAVFFFITGALFGVGVANVFRPPTPAEQAAFERFMSPTTTTESSLQRQSFSQRSVFDSDDASTTETEFLVPGAPVRIVRAGDKFFIVAPVQFVGGAAVADREQPTP